MWNARVLVFVLYLVINVICGKRFETRCKLVRELLKIGMPNDMFLGQSLKMVKENIMRKRHVLEQKILRYVTSTNPHWARVVDYCPLLLEDRKPVSQLWEYCKLIGVCLIEKVSKRDTSAFIATPSGKKYYGLYQIPKEWCKQRKRGGLCNMTCEALLDEDIRDDTACALQIAEQNGFQYWSKWTTRCKNDNFITTEIYKCPDLMRLTPERSLSSNSQYRRSPPRLRRSAYRPRRISKVSRFRRSRHIN